MLAFFFAAVNVFGILGNILVILSILRQKKMLKNNYYFLALHLAICDLAVLISYLSDVVQLYSWFKKSFFVHLQMVRCHLDVVFITFQCTGVSVMLIISLLRYRATVYPLKPAISRRELKVVCSLTYLVGFIAACGIQLPRCWTTVPLVYFKLYNTFWILFVYFVPTVFMAVVYYKISRALINQRKYIKQVCSNAMRRPTPDSSFNILRYMRNRRTFLVCLSCVLCYAISHIPMSVWFMWGIVVENRLLMNRGWLRTFVYALRVVGSHSVNPLIYGILDKKLLTFWKRKQ